MKTSEIAEALKHCGDEELPAFIREYEQDERSAVKALVEKARRRDAALKKERERTHRLYALEREYGGRLVCGIDEVGRGPLAGPVVACAMILPADHEILYLNDSKKLSEKKREELYEILVQEAVAYGIGSANHERIDEINILNATYEAMREAIAALDPRPEVTINDAVTIPGIEQEQRPVIKGDAKVACIAAASIVAKVTRDRLMTEYDVVYPGYGFAENKGYGTQAHMDALKKMGPTPIHRRSFIKNFL